MGEEMSNLIIFADGKPVAYADSCTIDCVPLDKPVEVPFCRSAEPFEITGIVTTDAESAKTIRRMFDSLYFSRKEIKRMFHAVTHGQRVIFPVTVEKRDGTTEPGKVVCGLPSTLRQYLQAVRHLRVPYHIEKKNF